MALARGCSSNPEVAKLGHLIHLALLPCGPRATGNSGFDDPRWRCHGFSFHSSYLPTIFFHLPFGAVILNF